MDISAPAVSLAARPRTGHLGHQGSHAPERPVLHLVSSSRRPRQENGTYVIVFSLSGAVPLFVPSAVPSSRPAQRAGRRAQGLSRLAALAATRRAWSCRVGRGVATPTPHRPGCADFQRPVLHGRVSLTPA